ncbi:MAG: hypothetical protein ACC652_15780, partial [Acidimicrobiales bacterium]
MSEIAAIQPPAAQRSILDHYWRRVARLGAIGAFVIIFIALVGMPLSLDTKMVIAGTLSLGYLSLVWVPFAVGMASASQVSLEGVDAPKRGVRELTGGALTGLVSGLGISLLMLLIDTFDLKEPFVWWIDRNNEFLSLPGLSLSEGMLLWPLIGATLGLIGAAILIAPRRL